MPTVDRDPHSTHPPPDTGSWERCRSLQAVDDLDVPAGESTDTSRPERPSATHRIIGQAWRTIRETAILIAVAVGLALVIKTVLVQAFYIPSGSMEPGLVENDRILVQKVSYWFSDPHRGDVIVFKDPANWLGQEADAAPTGIRGLLSKVGLYPTGGHLVKRVIGLPGDTVECCDDQGRIVVNGQPLDEDDFIAPQPDCDGPMAGCPTGNQKRSWMVTVPADSLFVMGDNRGDSADSSFHLCNADDPDCDNSATFVPIDDVVGKVTALVWPLNHGKFITTPDVFDTVPDPS